MWDSWEERIFCKSYSIVLTVKDLILCVLHLKMVLRTSNINFVGRSRANHVLFFLYKTWLLKPPSWKCCGKTHDETLNAFVKFAVLQETAY